MHTAEQNLHDEVAQLKKINLQLQQQLAQKQRHIERLLEQFRLQRQRRFGASSEQAPGQGTLFNEAESLVADLPAEPAESPAADGTPKQPRRGHRRPLPKELPRVDVVHDLAACDQRCACGCQMNALGEEVSEQLDIIPAQVRVIRHIRKKYACPQCQTAPITAPLPVLPIPKSNASAGLLAHIAVAKYQDALPLHRQEAILQRAGIDLSRQTLARWMIQTAGLLQPLHNLLRDELLCGPVIHCDETVVQVLKEPDKPPQSQSYMWVQAGGPLQHNVVLFDYHPSRSGQVPLHLLAGYQGYLMTDGYEGYNALAACDGLTHLCCWAHVRRKFIEAQRAQPKTKGAAKTGKVDAALNYIGKLYGIERSLKDVDAAGRYRARQQQSVPVLEQLRLWLDQTRDSVLPTGKLGEALQYLHKYWPKLIRYTHDGGLPIDNNRVENAIRPFVIGRKNWLFSDTPHGAAASAVIYSVIESAKANGLEPYGYLRHLLTMLPATTSVEAIEQLLPWQVDRDALIEGLLH
ncbi:MAG: IS66 family transposase [Gammaproteobacteria bacterium]|nr:IS66 family transposase [Gammaproteobacteria bacterium]